MTRAGRVAVVMGSDTDLPVMETAIAVLKEFEVDCEVRVLSAHRTPEATMAFAASARDNSIAVIIAAAGGAAHLAGVLAAATTLPVLAVPIPSTSFAGFDALLAMVQMPGGVPVAVFAVGAAGAKNAALFAIAMLASGNPILAEHLERYRREMAAGVAKKDVEIRARFA